MGRLAAPPHLIFDQPAEQTWPGETVNNLGGDHV
jgi:hypothetical protein